MARQLWLHLRCECKVPLPRRISMTRDPDCTPVEIVDGLPSDTTSMFGSDILASCITGSEVPLVLGLVAAMTSRMR